jgi:hypothetical protein
MPNRQRNATGEVRRFALSAILLQVLSEIDGRHAADAERALDVIAPGEGSRELLSGMHRRVVEPLRYCCVSGCRASPL